jgi:hypothetical protein
MRNWVLFIWVLTIVSSASAYQINIITPASVTNNPVSGLTVEDVRTLLQSAGAGTVSINGNEGNIVIHLPEIPTQSPLVINDLPYPYVQVPDRQYHWEGKMEGSVYHLSLTAPGAEAVSAGLYGLLHEILGFHFYHPRGSQLPDLSVWPITQPLSYHASPRFDKMGFHLHTMHPLELTEALLDENFPGGEKRVREYIDWLARNRQNYFEFNLLETINRKTWPAYAAKWVQYMEDRGIIAGLDLSLHMKQQVAFKLYRNPPRSFRSKKKQVKRRIDQLTAAKWKVFNMEFSQTEFSKGNETKKAAMRSYVQQLLEEKGIHLTGREHVVKPETMIGGAAKSTPLVADAADARRGTMIHTVMFYSLNDTLAPVYGNENLHHMRDMLLDEIKQRETWYYPESAYWITFDNSIPMFLSPYLGARLEDILYCDTLDVLGHLTFSSGWEWGYWLIDWSIANWSWKSTVNATEIEPYPEQYFDLLFPDQNLQQFFKAANDLQQQEIKTSNLMQYLTAATVTDELPGKLKLPLQPMPSWSYKFLRNNASKATLDSVMNHVIPALEEFASQYFPLRKTIRDIHYNNDLLTDIVHGMDMAGLRAQHRAATLRFICETRLADINKDKPAAAAALQHLETAAEYRKKGLEVVRYRESRYRYPSRELSTQRIDHTAYHFGYLYPLHDLHFWYREEQQARKNKWGFLFMNIWNIPRIIGITEK